MMNETKERKDFRTHGAATKEIEEDIDRNVRAFLYLLGKFRDRDLDVYEAMAPGYDSFARPWDTGFGKPALDRVFKTLAEKAPKGGAVLDAGCGTGLRIPRILEATDPKEVAALDISPKMLEIAGRRRPDRRVRYGRGDVRHLSFTDNLFDAVISTWTVELIDNPHSVVSEFLRVLKPGGIAVYTFVTLPPGRPERIANRLARDLFSGDHDLDPEPFAPERRPFHACERSVLESFRDGVLSVVALGKCCSVEPGHLPGGVTRTNADTEVTPCT